MGLHDNDSGDHSPTGFAGLSSQVSDIDAEMAHVDSLPPARNAEMQVAGGTERQQPPNDRFWDQTRDNTGKSVNPLVWWGLGAAVIGITLIANHFGTVPPSTSPSATYSDEASPQEITVQGQAPASPQALAEEMPPQGYDLELNDGQVRYCLAQNIRITAAEPIVSNNNSAQINRFNALVSDYNSRCSQYRYLDSSMNLAREDVEAHRAELEQAGRELIMSVGTEVQPGFATDSDEAVAGSNPGAAQYGGADTSDAMETGPDGSASDDDNGVTNEGGHQND